MTVPFAACSSGFLYNWGNHKVRVPTLAQWKGDMHEVLLPHIQLSPDPWLWQWQTLFANASYGSVNNLHFYLLSQKLQTKQSFSCETAVFEQFSQAQNETT